MNLRLAAVPGAALLLLVASGCGSHVTRTTSRVQLTDPAGDAWLADSVKSTDGRAKNVDIIAADIRRGSRFLRVHIDYQALGPRASRQWA
jgi:hypothetical protein